MANSGPDNNMVEAIDLTLSSPEPEPRPRVIPRQPQLPTYFKKESQPNYRVTKPNQNVSQPAAAAIGSLRHHAGPSRTAHIARILNSSNPEILKKVLLELCQVSPALLGALERGLATHSRRENKTMPHRSIPEQSGRRDVRNVPSEKQQPSEAKRKYATPHSRPGHYDMSQSEVAKGPSTIQRNAFGKPHASLPVSRIKIEPPAQLSGSNSDSDDDLRIPGSFPNSAQRLKPPNPALPDQTGSTPIANRSANPLSLSERLAKVQQENLKDSKRCSRCRDLFVREDDVCLYHSGHKTVLPGGRGVAWTCCMRHQDEKGCRSGRHIADTRPTFIKAEKAKLCSRCHGPWTTERFDCAYHPGERTRRPGGQTVYSCCDELPGSLGCEFGDHVDPDKGFSFLLKRASPSPDSLEMQQKKSRMY